jgi:hypothetical protein
MAGRGAKLLNVLFLLVLLIVAAGINFFHTDSSTGMDPRCPACHFQNSAIATAEIDSFELPVLTGFEFENLRQTPALEIEVTLLVPARGPPLV